MRTLIISAFLLTFIGLSMQAQNKNNSSDQTRTIEIDNDHGELYISFSNGVITEFIVNNTPIAKERYGDYKDIIEEFSQDNFAPPSPPSPPSPLSLPSPPSPPNYSGPDVTFEEASPSENLQKFLVDYLLDMDIIDSENKYNIHLTRDFLKVDKKELGNEIHGASLDIFNEIYGHKLNEKSEVKFKKSRNKSRSSIRIVD